MIIGVKKPRKVPVINDLPFTFYNFIGKWHHLTIGNLFVGSLLICKFEYFVNSIFDKKKQ